LKYAKLTRNVFGLAVHTKLRRDRCILIELARCTSEIITVDEDECEIALVTFGTKP